MYQPAFSGRHEQGGLGRITLHRAVAVLVKDHRVIAEHPGEQALRERGMFRHSHRAAAEAELTGRIIARAGDLIDFSAREDFAHGHLIFR